MADDDYGNLLANAQEAYKQGDRRKGAEIIATILEKDFNHRETWEFLYDSYNTGQLLEDFRKEFTQKFYPDKLPLLHKLSKKRKKKRKKSQGKTEPSPNRSSPAFGHKMLAFITQVKGWFQRKPKKHKRQTSEPPIQSSTDSEPKHPVPSAKPSISGVEKDKPPTVEIGSLLKKAARSQLPEGYDAIKPLPPSIQPQGGQTGTPAAPLDSAQKIRVMVVDDITQTRENVIRSLLFQGTVEVVGTATTGAQAIEVAKETQPDVVVMDVNMPDMDGITATTHIRREVKGTQVIILTVQDDVDYLRKAMLAGARDFLTKPPMIDDLLAAVHQASKIARQERAAATPVAPATGKAIFGSGKVITIYSPKGGTGCSMLSANLAAALHKDDNPVVLVDGNLQFGDIPFLFNCPGRFTILDLAPRSEELDSELIEEVLTRHASGVKLLAPPRPEQAEMVSANQFTSILRNLAMTYSYVIIDAPHPLEDLTLAAIDESDLLVLITTQDIPAIARAKKFLDLSPLINLDKGRILVVLNGYDKRVNIPPETVSQAFEHDLGAILPQESAVVLPSVNRGAPFMLQEELSTHPIVKEIARLAEAIRGRLDVH